MARGALGAADGPGGVQVTDEPITCPYVARDAAEEAAERGDTKEAVRLYELAARLARQQKRTLRGLKL